MEDDDVKLPLLTLLRLRLFVVWFDPLVIMLVRWYSYLYNYYYHAMQWLNIWLFNHIKSEVFARYRSKYGILNIVAAYVPPADAHAKENDGSDFIHLDIQSRMLFHGLQFTEKKLMFLLENLVHSDCTLCDDAAVGFERGRSSPSRCISMADVTKFTGANVISMFVHVGEALFEKTVIRPGDEFPTYMYSKGKNSGFSHVRSPCETSHFQPFTA